MTSPTVAAEAAGTSMFGTLVSDIQDNVVVGDDAITGTLKYLDTGDIPAVWGNGNFLALKFSNFDARANSVKVGLRPTYGGPGGTTPIDDDSGLVEILTDPDKNGVFKIEDKATQKFKVVSTNGSITTTKVYDLSGLVVENA